MRPPGPFMPIHAALSFIGQRESERARNRERAVILPDHMYTIPKPQQAAVLFMFLTPAAATET